MRIGITATRALTPTGQQHITDALSKAAKEGCEMVIVGGAIGGDAFAARAAHALRLWVRVILPLDTKEVDPDWRQYADEAEGSYPYRERNTRIVDQCSTLYAFPAYPEDDPRSKRSGTWMTVRIARQKGRSVQVWVQDTPPSTQLDKPRRGGTRLTKQV